MPKGTKFKKYLSNELLDADFAAEYIVAALEENDADFLNQALAEVVKAHGISDLSEETGIARQAIYAMTSKKGNPTLQNMNKILNAIGLELTVRSKKSAS
jgi:probable addiction module antidote protein